MKETVFPEHWMLWTLLRPQLLTDPLHASDGRPLQILDPGRRNPLDGPDLLQAVVQIGAERWRGDIEFHRSCGEWYRHGHDRDPRYANVVLHVLWDGPVAAPLQKRFAHLLLSRQLAVDAAAWHRTMERLEAHHLPYAALPPPEVSSATLNEMAWRRFRRRRERLQGWCRQFPVETVCYLALAETLGYSHNQFPLRHLLWQFPPDKILAALPGPCREPLAIWVLLMLRGGLLTTLPPAADLHERLQTWSRIFSERGLYPLLGRGDWHFRQVRPANHPALRLAALAQLLSRYCAGGLFRELLSMAMQRLPLKDILPQWTACLCQPLQRSLRRCLEAAAVRPLPRRVPGEQRAGQFIVNALLPLLSYWAERTGNPGFSLYIEDLYRQFPGTEQHRGLQRAVAAIPDSLLRRRLRVSAFLQQGMLELLAERAGEAGGEAAGSGRVRELSSGYFTAPGVPACA